MTVRKIDADEKVDRPDGEPENPRRLKWVVTGMWVAMTIYVTLTSFLLITDRRADQRAAREEQQRSCQIGLTVREQYEEIDRTLWGRAADELGAEPEVKAGFLDFISQQYGALPPPSAC